ncbi:MAG TPA: hypothetical protein VGB45_07375 [Abditibacterium sp.]
MRWHAPTTSPSFAVSTNARFTPICEGLTGRRDRTLVAQTPALGLRPVEIHRLNHESIEGDLDNERKC